MDQINYAMPNMLQELTKAQAPVKPAAKDDKSSGSRFKELMDQYRQDTDSPAKAEGRPATEISNQTQTGQQVEEGASGIEDETTLQNQMALAAMAALSAPIVPVETQTNQAAVHVEQAVQAVLPTETQAVATIQSEAVSGDPQGQQSQMKSQLGSAPQADTASVTTTRQSTFETGTKLQETPESTRMTEGQADTQEQDVEVTVLDLPQKRVFGEVESVPVKVGEAVPAGQSERAESIETQVQEPLTKALERGESKVEIQLQPEHLGSVKVELTRHTDGTLQVILTAESGRTQALLEKHAAMLQSTLFSQTQEPVRVIVENQDNQQHTGDYPQGHGQGGQPQEQHQQRQQQNGQDFLQQLRLGLMPLQSETAS